MKASSAILFGERNDGFLRLKPEDGSTVIDGH
jgi:hypothetical protein